jgi:superfamily I DNA/RNA helicase
MKLSPEVLRIARTRHPRVEVTACPGSGKTTAIVSRASHLISEGQAAGRILIVSFSNDAVDNLRRRLGSVDGGSSVQAMTCHKLALRIIRRNLALAGLDDEPTIISDSQARSLVGQAIKTAAKALATKQINAGPRELRDLKAQVAWLQEQSNRSASDAVTRLFIYAAASRTALADLGVWAAEGNSLSSNKVAGPL